MTGNTAFLPDDVYQFLDRRVRVRSNSEAARDRLRLMYSRFRLDGGADDEPAVLFQIDDRLDTENLLMIRDGRREYRLTMTGRFPEYTCQDLASGEFVNVGFIEPPVLVQAALLETVAAASGRRAVLFHAGVVARDGRALILSARSRMGKTTLVLNLLRRGCEFLSDEVAWLDTESGTVFPFPRRINMRQGGMDLLGLRPDTTHTLSGIGEDGPEYAVDAEEIPGVRIGGPACASVLVFLKGFADEPVVEELAPANAAFELMNSAIGPLPDPAGAMFEIAPVLDGMRCFHLTVGDSKATADVVMTLADDTSNGPG